VNAEELTAEDDWMAELLALSADKHVRNELDISVWREGEKDGYGLPNPRTRFQFLLWAHFDRLVAEVDSLRTQLAEAQKNADAFEMEWDKALIGRAEAEARETALREALEDSDNAWEDDNLADLMTARGFRWARALSGEQGEQE
jgi:hypothetical protein